MQAIKYWHGDGEIIVPPLTWVSDIASVLHAGLKPVFCDINLRIFSFDLEKLKSLITDDTRAIFLTTFLVSMDLLRTDWPVRWKDILLIEGCLWISW